MCLLSLFFGNPRPSLAALRDGILPYIINMFDFWTVRWIIFSTNILVDLSVLEFVLLYWFIEVLSLFTSLLLTVHSLRCRKEGFCYPHLKEPLSNLFCWFVQPTSLHVVTRFPAFASLFFRIPWLLFSACCHILFDFQSSDTPFLQYHSPSQMVKKYVHLQ